MLYLVNKQYPDTLQMYNLYLYISTKQIFFCIFARFIKHEKDEI